MSLNMLNKYIVTIFAALVFSSATFAEQVVDKKELESEVIAKITEKMDKLQVKVFSVSPFVVDGLYEVLTDRGVLYISEDRQFLIKGAVYDLDNNGENISEKSYAALRKSRLVEFEKDMIVYQAEDEKHVITVFTDTSCGYCRKLHAEMADYNKLGITVRYLAFPRGGLQSETYQTMASIWCAEDPKSAMNNAKQGQEIASKSCQNTIKEQYELGLLFGVSGTPALVLEDGTLNPGYLPAKNLIQMLDQRFK